MPNKTSELPGVEGEGVAPKRIKVLDDAIDEWREIVSKRTALSEKEKEAKERVNHIMHDKGLTIYLYTDEGDVEKECVIVDSVKLRRVKDSDEGDE